MKEENHYAVLPSISVSPSKIAFYSRIFRRKEVSENHYQLFSPCEKMDDLPSSKKVTKKVSLIVNDKNFPEFSNIHNLELSHKARKRIKEKVTWLYHLAKKKHVTFSNGKTIYNHKMSFITLTLPAEQVHTSAEIIAKPLHNFITEMGRRFGMENYVWRLEWQKNGNAHFHIATDVAVDYFKIRSIWNRSIQLLGYVSRYQEKMSKLSLLEYSKLYTNTDKTDFNTIKARYSHGVATRWFNPNTVSVNSAVSGKEIAFYISKYITKESNCSLSDEVLERENGGGNFRLWFCSRSLSKLSNVCEYIENMKDDLIELVSNIKPRFRQIMQYCEMWYYSSNEQSRSLSKKLNDYFLKYAYKLGYVPAGYSTNALEKYLEITCS